MESLFYQDSAKQLHVLILCEHEVHRPQPAADSMFKGLSIFKNHSCRRASYESFDFARIREGDLLKLFCRVCQIAECEAPPQAMLEANVNPPARPSLFAFWASPLPTRMRKR